MCQLFFFYVLILQLHLIDVNSLALPYKQIRSQNVPGNLFVDESCIDCDVCRWMCPNIFDRKGIKSAVYHQPDNENDKLQAYAAMIACPVGSIRLKNPDPLVKDAIDAFPAEIDPDRIPGVMHLGFHSPESFGATAYFVKRSSELGNIMIDTPRFNKKLAENIKFEGGLKYIILTHKDDVADHQKWAEYFPQVKRIIHSLDTSKNQGTDQCELILQGISVLTIENDYDNVKLWRPDEDLKIIHTPGHTPGSLCVEVTTSRESILFTGDHLAFSNRLGQLTGFPQYNHGSLEIQARSMEILVSTTMKEMKESRNQRDNENESGSDGEKKTFQWILPAHGRMFRFLDQIQKEKLLLNAAQQLRDQNNDINPLYFGYQ